MPYAFTHRICTHPNLRPTEWEQKRPAPAQMSGCEHSYSCPVCGEGVGVFPDPCHQSKLDQYTTWNQTNVFERLAAPHSISLLPTNIAGTQWI